MARKYHRKYVPESRPDCPLMEDDEALFILGNRLACFRWFIWKPDKLMPASPMHTPTLEEFRHHKGWMQLMWLELMHLDIVPTGTEIPKQFRRGWTYGDMKDCETKKSFEALAKYDLVGFH